MLKFMRKHAKSYMIKVIFAAIIVVFVGYFGYGSLSKMEKPALQIGPYKVSFPDYHEAYNKQMDMYKMIYRDRFDEKMLKELKLEEKVKDDLVNRHLLLMKADQLGLLVSDREFADVLNSLPAFQMEGKFNKERYLAALRSNNLSPERFEESQKQTMLIQKVANVIQDTGTFLNDSDVWASYVKEKGKINLAYAEFDPSTFKSKVNVGEKEALDLYEKEKGSFKAENAYRLKELVVDEKGPLKDDAVYMDLLKAKDMEAYGKEKGLAVVDLGSVKENELVKKYGGLKIEDLKSMKKGDISLPVRASGKSYIFQLIDKEEGRPFDKTLAMAKIKERLTDEKAKAYARAAAEEAIKSKSFAVKKETGFVPRNVRGIAGIGEIPKESSGIFSLSKTDPVYDKPLELSGKYYVFSYKDEKSPDKAEWEKDKEGYTRYFQAKNRQEHLTSFLAEMRKTVKIKDYRKES